MTQNLLADAIDSLRDHKATEACQLFRGDMWLLTATMLPDLPVDARRGALELLPVATMADRVHHVAFTTADVNGVRTDAVSWLDAPVDPAGAPPRLVLYPYSQQPDAAVAWGDPVEMGAESAVFGGLTDAFAAIRPTLASAAPDQIDLFRVAAIDHLTKIEVAVQMSEEFSTELHEVLARVG